MQRSNHNKRSHLRPALLALCSTILLVLSYPNGGLWWCAWIALVPWLVLLNQCSLRGAFLWSYAVGFFFFIGSMWWIIHVTFIGWILLCAYLAAFFGAFGYLTKRSQLPILSFTHLLLLPAVWVSLEFIRSHLFSGFGWNLLAYTQTPWLDVIQFAEWTGAWGISFLIVLVNVSVASVLIPGLPVRRASQYILLAAGCVIAAVGFGGWRIASIPHGPIVRLAVVQGNISTEEKWDRDKSEIILKRYVDLTQQAALEKPQLIVWPETSAPGYVGIEEPLTQQIKNLAESLSIPLLIGSPGSALSGLTPRSTNAALLIGTDGSFIERYDKLKLVPFGEFIPMESILPWLRGVLPPIGDFIPGHKHTVFNLAHSALPSSSLKFSVLICFEDIFPELARRFVEQGAVLLLNITNDAWFGPTQAAYQHAQASTFRAVELRVPVARAANTGWSGCIDNVGRWRAAVHDANGEELFIPGSRVCELETGKTRSGYLRWGDWFAGLCLLAVFGWFMLQFLSWQKPEQV